MSKAEKRSSGVVYAAACLAACIAVSAGSARADTLVDPFGTVAADGSNGAGTLTGGFIQGDKSWTHSYDPIEGTILSATLAMDILDGDGGGAFLYAGTDASGTLIGFTSNFGEQGVSSPAWRDLFPLSPPTECGMDSGSCDNLFTLPESLFADLADGSFSVFADIQEGPVGRWGSNRALLTIEYSPLAIPEPETYALLLAGLGLLGFAARRK